MIRTTMTMQGLVFVLVVLFTGCQTNAWQTTDGGQDSGPDADGDSDGDADGDGDGDADGDADGDGDGDADGDADGDGDADAAPDSWVAIVTPTGGEVENPVTFSFDASDDVVTVTLEADGWPLHDEPLSAGAWTHTYEFSGVDTERHVVLTGFDAGGEAVASDDVWITPVNPVPDRVFPLDLDASGLYLSNFDSSSSTASFGAGRSGGRLHAGCDLYWTHDDAMAYANAHWPHNDNRAVYAIADGTITNYYAFYLGTSAVEVDHGDFVVRYGEVDDGGLHGGLTIGSTVTAGQQIAIMGDLAIGSTWSMLHLELYSGELSGSLTDSSNWSYLHVTDGNWQRRGDLMDCTPFLLELLAEAGW